MNAEFINVFSKLQKRLELLINMTQTGDLRNTLTEENIEALGIINSLYQKEQLSAEEVLKQTWKDIDMSDRWINDKDNVKYYKEDIVIQAMHDFANNSEQKESNVKIDEDIIFSFLDNFQTLMKDEDSSDEDLRNTMFYYRDSLIEMIKGFANNSEAMKQHAMGFSNYVLRYMDEGKDIFRLYNDYLTNKEK